MKVFSSILASLAAAAAENLSGSYEGSVPFIIDVNADFKGDATADFDLNVKVASKRFNCPGEKITETDSQVTFKDIMTTGDCLGDGIRTDGKDPSKYTIDKNSDGTLTFNSDGYPALKMKKKALMAADALSGKYEGQVPFIIDVNADFKGDSTADFDLNVKVASKRFNCPGEKITETDSLVTFTDIMTTGDCLGDGIREDKKDPSKYTIAKNSDGTLTFNSDGYPALKMTKKALMVADALSGKYEGQVPFIIDVNADFKGDSTADFDLNVKVASKRFNCPGEKIIETDSLVTFKDIMTTGDCLGDGIRTDGKDPSKYTIAKNSDGTLTFNSDGYPALKMTAKSSAIMV